MKTTHIVLEDSGKTKKLQVDLSAETALDEQILNRPFTPALQDHVLLYANDLFPNFSVLQTIDSSQSPKRTILLLQSTKGI
jgi:Cu/Ag efflux pump CusA